jgi:dihydroorotase-like cyclic amidohydrolase
VDFRPDQTIRLTASDLAYRHPMSPWVGRELTGVVAATYLRGTMVYRRADGVLTRAGREVLPSPVRAR